MERVSEWTGAVITVDFINYLSGGIVEVKNIRKTIIWLIIFAVATAYAEPCRRISATPPPRVFQGTGSTPQGFVRWINDRTLAMSEPLLNKAVYNKYVDTYKVEQNHIMVPNPGEELRYVKWDAGDVALTYVFDKYDIEVYPIKQCRKEKYYSNNIAAFIENRDGIKVPSEKVIIDCLNNETGFLERETESYETKGLFLRHYRTVPCVEYMYQYTCKNGEKNYECKRAELHFFVAGMYVNVIAYIQPDSPINLAEEMKEIVFEKIYTNPRIKHSGKRITKKQAIIYAMLYNPTKDSFTDVKFYIYNKKTKRYQLVYCEKVPKKNRKKQKVSIKLNVQKCLKKGRKQLRRKKVYPINRRKGYRYRIRAKVGKKYYDVTNSFRLK